MQCSFGSIYMTLRTPLAKDEAVNKYYYGVKMLLVNAMPTVLLALITVAFARFLATRKQERKIVLKQTGDKISTFDGLTHCLVSVAVVAICLVTPHLVYSVMVRAEFRPCAVRQMGFITQYLEILNSSVNFFIYYATLGSFRAGVGKSLKVCGRETDGVIQEQPVPQPATVSTC